MIKLKYIVDRFRGRYSQKKNELRNSPECMFEGKTREDVERIVAASASASAWLPLSSF